MEVTGLCVITSSETGNVLARVESDRLHKIGNVETQHDTDTHFIGCMYPFVHNSRLHGAIVHAGVLRICEVHDGKMVDVIAYNMHTAAIWDRAFPYYRIQPLDSVNLDANGNLVFYRGSRDGFTTIVTANLSGDIRSDMYIYLRIDEDDWRPTTYDAAGNIHYIVKYSSAQHKDTKLIIHRYDIDDNVKILDVMLPFDIGWPLFVRVRHNIVALVFMSRLIITRLDVSGYIVSFGLGIIYNDVNFLSDNTICMVGTHGLHINNSRVIAGHYLNLSENIAYEVLYAEGTECPQITSLLSGQ